MIHLTSTVPWILGSWSFGIGSKKPRKEKIRILKIREIMTVQNSIIYSSRPNRRKMIEKIWTCGKVTEF